MTKWKYSITTMAMVKETTEFPQMWRVQMLMEKLVYFVNIYTYKIRLASYYKFVNLIGQIY